MSSGPSERCSSRNERMASITFSLHAGQPIVRPVPFGVGSWLQAVVATAYGMAGRRTTSIW